MVIIKIEGGLGNQMFQYSLYLKMLNMGRDARVDCSDLSDYLNEHGWDTIFNIFDLSPQYATYEENRRLKDNPGGKLSKVRRRIFGIKRSHYIEKKGESGKFNPDILAMDDVYLEGYWQTYGYFDSIKEKVIETFTFQQDLNSDNEHMLREIEASACPVSVHVRLGDYNTADNRNIYGNICTLKYYDRAVRYISQRVEDPFFFVFSNDPKEAGRIFGDRDNFVVIDINDEMSGWCDMLLMSKCKHNIIANSTFSWWGGYLNKNPNKIIVAPAKWVGDRDMSDICCPDWVRIQG